jgi:hypothetical protein
VRTVNKWKTKRAWTALHVFNLRKTYDFSDRQRKPRNTAEYHHSRQCPVDKCMAIVRNLLSHLLKFHRIQKNTDNVNTGEKTARKLKEDADESVSSSLCSDSDGGKHSDAASSMSVESDATAAAADDTTPATNDDTVTAPAAPVGLPTDFVTFQTWLQSTDGGRKCEKSAKQYAFQVGVIFGAIDENASVSSLWNKKLVSKFLSEDAVERQFLPGTVKSYLSSLRHWYSYVLAEESDMPSRQEKDMISNMSDRVARWINSYRKDAASRTSKKWMQTLES